MAHRLFGLHLDWRLKKNMIGYWLTEESEDTLF